MSDATVPADRHIATVKALVTLINHNDQLQQQLADYEEAFEQFARDAHNAENAASWLAKEDIGDTYHPIPYTLTAPAFSEPPHTEEPDYSLAEAAAILERQGINTGQNKLRKYLNEGICWTDGFGSPRAGVADNYLIQTEPPNPSRGAVVRITPEGLNELLNIMKVSI